MSAAAMLFHRRRESQAERVRRGRALGRAMATRRDAVPAAIILGCAAFALAYIDPTMLGAFFLIGGGSYCAFTAAGAHHRADALLERSVRAGLADGSVEPDAVPLVLDGVKVRLSLDLHHPNFRAVGHDVKGNRVVVTGAFNRDKIPAWAEFVFLSPEDYAALRGKVAPDGEEAIEQGRAAA